MGGSAHIVVVGGPRGLASAAERRVADLESRWSRFRPDSELSRLNSCAGAPVTVSAETVQLVERAVAAWRLTGGLFDPTVLTAMHAAGYAGSFETLCAEPGNTEAANTEAANTEAGNTEAADAAATDPAGSSRTSPSPSPGCQGILVDARRRTVSLPAGVGLDAGGIAKGFAADLVVGELMAAGAEAAMVSLSGDVVVAGHPRPGRRWTVSVAHPLEQGGELARLQLDRGAVATSSRLKRAWIHRGQPRHHLIDPDAGTPVSGPLVAVTAVAGAGWWAEALTKAILVSGRLGQVPNASAITVDRDGTVCATVDLEPAVAA